MKRFLITGASTGIGRACAVRLANRGHVVYAGVRRNQDGESLRAQAGDALVPILLDITTAADIAAAADSVASDGGTLDGLVNNAGIGRGGPLEFLDLDEWREQFEVNVFGHVAVTRALLPSIRAAHGRIVVVGSMLGRTALPMMGPYCASKFAIEALAEALRHDVARFGVGVSIVEPGTIRTPMHDKAADTVTRLETTLPDAAADLYGEQIDAIRKTLAQQVRCGAPPERVAGTVERAVRARRPRTRYRVGIDARAANAMTRLLPDRTRESGMRRFATP